jgi:hypothetical protein
VTWPSMERAAQGLGQPMARAAAVAASVGAVALLAGLALGRAGTAFATLQASWLFFAGLATGSVAVAAAVRVAHGEWADELLPIALAGVGFFGPAFAILAILSLGQGVLAPSGPEAGTARLATFAARQLVTGLLAFGLGARFVRTARSPQVDPVRVRSAGVAYLLAYAIGGSLWAFAFVVEPASHSIPTVLLPASVLGAFLSGLAWIALVAAIRDVSGADGRHDLGKLLFGFVLLWSYLLWSLYLPTWYGNVPSESTFLLARWTGAYKPVALGVIATVFVGPFAILFLERFKRNRSALATAAAMILIGLWAEKVLLVLPSVRTHPDRWDLLLAATVTAGVGGLYLLSVGAGLADVRSSPPRGQA